LLAGRGEKGEKIEEESGLRFVPGRGEKREKERGHGDHHFLASLSFDAGTLPDEEGKRRKKEGETSTDVTVSTNSERSGEREGKRVVSSQAVACRRNAKQREEEKKEGGCSLRWGLREGVGKEKRKRKKESPRLSQLLSLPGKERRKEKEEMAQMALLSIVTERRGTRKRGKRGRGREFD